MRDRIASVFPFVLLVLLAAMTFWLSRVIQTGNPQGMARHDPDYIVDRFTVRRFDTNGQLQHTFAADKMLHYPDDNTTEVSRPHVSYLQRPPTEIFARAALVSQDGKQIDLIDEVRVVRHNENSQGSVMETSRLSVFPDIEQARTQEPVVLTQGRSVVNGIGLEIDNKTGLAVLKGRVTGTIHRNGKK